MIIPDVSGTGIGVLSPETAAKISGFTSEISDTSIAPETFSGEIPLTR